MGNSRSQWKQSRARKWKRKLRSSEGMIALQESIYRIQIGIARSLRDPLLDSTLECLDIFVLIAGNFLFCFGYIFSETYVASYIYDRKIGDISTLRKVCMGERKGIIYAAV